MLRRASKSIPDIALTRHPKSKAILRSCTSVLGLVTERLNWSFLASGQIWVVRPCDNILLGVRDCSEGSQRKGVVYAHKKPVSEDCRQG